MARKFDDLPVYQAAMRLWGAVNALLDRDALRRNRKLHEQISDANDSVPSNIAEGFDQPSDAAFSRYLYHSKGSLAELETRLGMASLKKYITLEELNQCRGLAQTVAKQLGGFIKYLAESDFKDRGRFKATSSSRTAERSSDKGSKD